jgi:RNA polymerase sigma-70 factor (ECF subfamily)
MMKDDDTKLVSQCLSGEIKAFENLVDKYQKTIFNIIYRMCHNYEDARDLTQGVFVRIYEKLSSYNPQFKFFSWIYRIAVNETLNHLNQKKMMNEIPESYCAEDSDPAESLEQLDMSKKIHDSLAQIDPKYRILIVLKHFQNCSYQQISQIMKLPEKTVKSRLYSARQQLGHVLMQRGIR